MTLEQALETAKSHHQANRLAEAEQLYRQVLQAAPNHPEAMFLLGYLARQVGQNDQALALFQRSIAIDPSNMDCHAALADLLLAHGHAEGAIESYRLVINYQPGRAEVHNNLAAALEMLGREEEAIVAYQDAVRYKPSWIEAHVNLGAALANASRFDEAAVAIEKAIKLDRRNPRSHTYLGNARFRQGNLEEAHKAYAAAVAAPGNDPPAHQIGDLADAYNNFGTLLDTRGQFDLALRCFRKAIKLDPQFAEAHYNLSLALLRQGNFKDGWQEFEWRWKCDAFRGFRKYEKPRWNGEDLAGKTIVLVAEQGLGDAIQFIRYVPMIAAKGAKIVVECAKPLISLFQTVEGISQVVERRGELPPYDFFAPLMSLPSVFSITPETIPAKVPYLNAPLSAIERWHGILSTDPVKIKIGIAWAGSRTHMKDRWRSIPPEALASLAAIPGISLHSLMLEKLEPELATKLKIHDHADQLTDLSETAALIEHMNLVISVDSVHAHLAGAMGKRVWNLLGVAQDWRWMVARTDTPWYPKMRLFRQATANEWTPVVQQVVDAISASRKK